MPMEKTAGKRIYEDNQWVVERETYIGWVSSTVVYLLYKKYHKLSDFPEAWRNLYQKFIKGQETGFESFFEDIKLMEQGELPYILWEEMTWDTRDSSYESIVSTLRDEYKIDLKKGHLR